MSQRNSWEKEHITALIDAYKSEKCLYAVKSPNYHNKNLRADALRRITNTILAIRPGTTEKDCSTKFHNLRTQFSVENAKVKQSMKSGVGTEDVYVPSLWYFKSLEYLAEHLVPRKSTASMIAKKKKQSRVSQEVADEIRHTPTTTAPVGTIEFTEDGRLLLYGEDVDDPDETQFSAYTDSLTTAETSTDFITQSLLTTAGTSTDFITQSLSPNLPKDSSSTMVPRPSPSSSQTSSTSSGVIDIPAPQRSARIQNNAKKRKNQVDDEYVGIMASIADSLKQPITIPNMAANSADPIDNCMGFIGSMLRGFVSEKLKLEVMDVLVQTVINARTNELERA